MVNKHVTSRVCLTQSERVGHGEVFNVGAGRNVSINKIAQLIGGPVVYVAPRLEPKHTLADSSYIDIVLGWKATIAIEEGILSLKKQFGLA